MADLIERSAAIKAADSGCKAWRGIFRDVKAELEQIPAVDAVPVVRGHWIFRKGEMFNYLECSNCGHLIAFVGWPNYCESCGVKMAERREGET